MISLLALAWLLFLLAPLILCVEYFALMWGFEEYRFFPIVFLATGLLIWERWDRRLRVPQDWWSRSLVVVSLLLLIVGICVWSPWIGLLSWLFAAGSWLATQRETTSSQATSLIALWAPCWLLLRLPLRLDTQLTAALQQRTSRLSSYLLDWLQIPHQRNGNVFDLLHGQLFVEDACSGVQSLFALLFVAFFLVVWQRRSLVLLPLYAVMAVVWSGVMNVVRVVAIGVAQESYRLDLAHGLKHEILGYICLTGAVLLLLSTDRAARVLFFKLPADQLERRRFNPLNATWNWLFGERPVKATELGSQPTRETGTASPGVVVPAVMIGCCVSLLIAQLAIRPTSVLAEGGKQEVLWNPPDSLFAGLNGNVQIGEHEVIRGGDDISLGDNSDLWKIQVEGLSSRLAVSQPYNEYHDLNVCYVANGWELNQSNIELQQVDGHEWALIHATFLNKDGTYGTLFFSGLNRFGQALNPPETSLRDLLTARLKSLWKRDNRPVDYNNLMVQLWTVSGSPLTPQRVEALRQIHLQSREAVKAELSKS